jgi:uncharacterized protein (DUF736 family)
VTYSFRVETDDARLKPRHRLRYDGIDAADAMAAWSKAISQGIEYVTLEALRDRPSLGASFPDEPPKEEQ